LDGLGKIDEILGKVKKLNMHSLAITDHGAMYGAIEFYKKCKREGIKPIIGMEGYITDEDLEKKPERSKSKNYHLVLLAKNRQGYKNLMKLTSIAHLKGFFYKPRFDRKTLERYSQGVICLSGCNSGDIPQSLLQDDYQEAKKRALWYQNIFRDDFYLEIQRHEYSKYAAKAERDELRKLLNEQAEAEEKVFQGIKRLSRELGIPIVATNDVHYINKEDAFAQDALVCIGTGKNINDLKRLRFIDSPTFYLRDQKEMYELFLDMPEALENTVKISKKVDIEITLDRWYFPKFETDDKKKPEVLLREKAWKGIKNKEKKISLEMKERLEWELDVINKKGYSTYFLIVSDFADWCNKKGIITNTRGSTAGSLVAYALGIVNINPLKYDLPFERFLTPWRPSPPDIDFDIADNRREEVIDYISKKYGKQKVAQICTFGRMQARAAVRDVARVLGYSYSQGDRIAKLIPFGSQGFPITIEKALEVSSELKNLYENDEDAKRIIDLARKIEGNARHISVHAAGLVIAPEDITNFTPIQLDPEGKKIITQFDMDSLDPNVSPGEAVGLLKFDLLGLRNLTILGETIKIIEKEKGIKINLLQIPIDDQKTFKSLSRGETMGVFQLSGSGMTKYLKELKPTRVEDLMAMVALYRPGPISQIPEYIRRKNNPQAVEYFDPRMKEYLDKSYGLLVYQDDVFLTAIKIAGYTWEEADKLRKAVGKKIPGEMKKQKEKFIEGAIKNGMSREKAEELFTMIEPFSGYGFNKAHAASYGMVAYWTAYMKTNYPVEFMCALLSAEAKDTDKVSEAIEECRRMGIKVYSPDINRSGFGFQIVEDRESLGGKAIMFGLDAIKNVGEKAIEEIIKERGKSGFESFLDFLKRVDTRKVNKKVVESLIKVGAFSSFGNRASLLATYEEIKDKIQKQPKSERNQQGLFNEAELGESKINVQGDRLENIDEFTDEELEKLERELLGFSLSAKPISLLISHFSHLATHKVRDILEPDIIPDYKVKLVLVVNEVRTIYTKNSHQEMAFVKARDETGSVELVVFPKIFKKTKKTWIDNKPILIEGSVSQKGKEPSIIVESVFNPNEFQNAFYIKVPKGMKKESLQKLKKILTEHQGDQEVYLVVEGEREEKIKLPIKVEWNEILVQKILQVIEEDKLLN